MDTAQQRLEKLRSDAADRAMTAGEMPDKKQREPFFTMARQLNMLADYAEMALRANGRSDIFFGQKIYEPFPSERESGSVVMPDI
jgi:hypothetical protein